MCGTKQQFIELPDQGNLSMNRTRGDPSRTHVSAPQSHAYVQPHRPFLSLPSLQHVCPTAYDLSSGSFKIPSTSNRLRASSSAQVCIL